MEGAACMVRDLTVVRSSFGGGGGGLATLPGRFPCLEALRLEGVSPRPLARWANHVRREADTWRQHLRRVHLQLDRHSAAVSSFLRSLPLLSEVHLEYRQRTDTLCFSSRSTLTSLPLPLDLLLTLPGLEALLLSYPPEEEGKDDEETVPKRLPVAGPLVVHQSLRKLSLSGLDCLRSLLAYARLPRLRQLGVDTTPEAFGIDTRLISKMATHLETLCLSGTPTLAFSSRAGRR